MNPQTQRCLELYNEGVTAVQHGQKHHAVNLWREATALKPPLGLEVMLRRDVVTALFEEIWHLPRGARLNEQQAKDFKEAEESVDRLMALCSGEAPEGPVTDANPQMLRENLEFAHEVSKLSMKAGYGWFVFPGNETAERMAKFGTILANAGRKQEAAEVLSRAVSLLDSSADHGLTLHATVRLASCLNDTGQRKEAAHYAGQAISLGLKAGDLPYMAMQAIIENAR